MILRFLNSLGALGTGVYLFVLLAGCGAQVETPAPPDTSEAFDVSDGVAGLDVSSVEDVAETSIEDTGPQELPSVPDVEQEEDGGLPQITVPDVNFDIGGGQDTVADAGVQDIGPPPAPHVLFIGNSYTSGNNLKGWVADLAEAAEYEPGLTTQAITKGGAWLSDHLNDANTMETIATGGFTHVVLQEQSYLPLVAKGQFLLSATALASPIHQSGAAPVFFETWAREEGNPLYDSDLAGYTPATMQEALRDAYMTAASANDGIYAPVGDVWEATLAAHPDIDLFSGDGSHASKAGTYLAACVFYQVITGESPVGIPLGPSGLTDEEVTAIQEMAATGP